MALIVELIKGSLFLYFYIDIRLRCKGIIWFYKSKEMVRIGCDGLYFKEIRVANNVFLVKCVLALGISQ